MTRLGFGTIEGPMRHLPREILKHILSIDIVRRVKKMTRYVNLLVSDTNDWLSGDPFQVHPDDAIHWVLQLVKGVVNIRRNENWLRRIQK